MNIGEFNKLTNGLQNDVEIEINTIYKKESGEWDLSEICEAHYDKNRNKVCITPTFISITETNKEGSYTFSEIISTINAAINLLHNCGESNNEITENLDDVRLLLEDMWENELAFEDESEEN